MTHNYLQKDIGKIAQVKRKKKAVTTSETLIFNNCQL